MFLDDLHLLYRRLPQGLTPIHPPGKHIFIQLYHRFLSFLIRN